MVRSMVFLNAVALVFLASAHGAVDLSKAKAIIIEENSVNQSGSLEIQGHDVAVTLGANPSQSSSIRFLHGRQFLSAVPVMADPQRPALTAAVNFDIYRVHKAALLEGRTASAPAGAALLAESTHVHSQQRVIYSKADSNGARSYSITPWQVRAMAPLAPGQILLINEHSEVYILSADGTLAQIMNGAWNTHKHFFVDMQVLDLVPPSAQNPGWNMRLALITTDQFFVYSTATPGALTQRFTRTLHGRVLDDSNQPLTQHLSEIHRLGIADDYSLFILGTDTQTAGSGVSIPMLLSFTMSQTRLIAMNATDLTQIRGLHATSVVMPPSVRGMEDYDPRLDDSEFVGVVSAGSNKGSAKAIVRHHGRLVEIGHVGGVTHHRGAIMSAIVRSAGGAKPLGTDRDFLLVGEQPVLSFDVTVPAQGSGTTAVASAVAGGGAVTKGESPPPAKPVPPEHTRAHWIQQLEDWARYRGRAITVSQTMSAARVSGLLYTCDPVKKALMSALPQDVLAKRFSLILTDGDAVLVPYTSDKATIDVYALLDALVDALKEQAGCEVALGERDTLPPSP